MLKAVLMIFDEPWPENELETLGACPVCQSTDRTVLLNGLHDMAFRVAPGRWTLWRCGGCSAAYLDPRPAAAFIVKAYERYYTHGEGEVFRLDPPGPLDARTRFTTGVRNSWLNRRYGAKLPGAIPFGWLLAGLFSHRRRRVEQMIRHLPPTKGQRRVLLDAGCGSGDFLRIAGQLGYQAMGLDFDAEAVARGKAAGLDIRQGALPGTGLPPESVDYITVSHVLEHLHDPVGTLKELYGLLKPGGCLWITQPNLSALGLKEFGIAWRGLEPPRHLTLFEPAGLMALLTGLGFERITLYDAVPHADFYYRQSLAQRIGQDPYQPGPTPGWSPEWDAKVAAADAAAAQDASLSEALTLTAWKPA
ncbi:MAG: methyltransferase domain-containing protein [Niveispirillum sp.]|uniref:class I SAM-dependent methyltransferase n=1 Tax=Niveispirillum sp. TaxID=1917217 RepID=UPI003BA52852